MDNKAIEYLQNEIRTSIVKDIVNVAAYHGRYQKEKDSGHFNIPRDVFCYVDHLGYIAYGDNSSTNRSIRFIKQFFSDKYKDFADLIYSMWRHGTVHQYKPISYYATLTDSAPDKIEVRWLSTNHNRKLERRQHLLFFPMQSKSNAVYLVMNNCELANDLLHALDEFICCLKTECINEQECAIRIRALNDVRDLTEIRNSRIASNVERQIGNALAKQGGFLNDKGVVIKKHPST